MFRKNDILESLLLIILLFRYVISDGPYTLFIDLTNALTFSSSLSIGSIDFYSEDEVIIPVGNSLRKYKGISQPQPVSVYADRVPPVFNFVNEINDGTLVSYDLPISIRGTPYVAVVIINPLGAFEIKVVDFDAYLIETSSTLDFVERPTYGTFINNDGEQ